MSHQTPNTLNRSLSCLSSPAVLLSIALLLLNDHLLKATIPSWFTGKLSDFAGLYFFPFVVAAFLALILDRFHQPPRRTGLLAFAFTALYFTLIKTAVPITTLTESAWSHLIGLPVQIIPDPTDLLALVVLLPAWKLWQRPPHKTPKTYPLIGWSALCLASLASLATSCLDIPVIDRLALIDDVLYAGNGYVFARYDEETGNWREISEPSPAAIEQPALDPPLLATACTPPQSNLCDQATGNENDSLSPEPVEAEQLPTALREELSTPPALPVTACVPEQPQLCYKITGDEKVYSSSDSGQTWAIAWEITAGRRYFITRYLGRFLAACKTSADMGPYDLIIIPGAGGYRVVVAMGNEGVLMRDEHGEWLRQELLYAQPTPLWTLEVGHILAILIEEEFILWLVSMLTLTGLLVIVRRSLWPLAMALLMTIFVGVPIGAIAAYASFTVFNPYLGLLIVATPATIMLVRRWRREDPTLSPKTVSLWLLTGIGVYVVGNIPLWLWTAGFISIYRWAVIASVLAVLLFLSFAGRHLLRLAKPPT